MATFAQVQVVLTFLQHLLGGSFRPIGRPWLPRRSLSPKKRPPSCWLS